jgi:glycosyltransferase involved in cell wall biosynthesis
MSTFSLIIPAYNEEQAIGAITERCLAARKAITEGTDIDTVEIIVVNDGSQDRTAEIAAQYPAVRLVSYEHNRGYGAAIKAGFAVARGDVLGFLDADGTCDPLFFRDLYRFCQEEQADIVLGSRLNPQSRMPLLRWVGNVLYALLLGILSSRAVTDTASGMRVLRRSVLPKLYPLPDGMHFTPAMSAKALLDSGLSIAEVPMPYNERVGVSKLKVVSDGVHFLQTILDAALMLRPARVFSLFAVPLLLLVLLYSMYPLEFYLQQGRLEEWMLYRFLVLMVLGQMLLMFLTASLICERMLGLISPRRRITGFFWHLLETVCQPQVLRAVGVLLLLGATVLNYKTIIQYLTTGQIHEHWSRVLIGGFCVSAAVHLFVTSVILYAEDLLREKRRWEASSTSLTQIGEEKGERHSFARESEREYEVTLEHGN